MATFDQSAVTQLENAYPEFKRTGFPQALLDIIPDPTRATFFDDFLGKALDLTTFWTNGGSETLDILPGGGGTAIPGGHVRLASATNGSPSRLLGPSGMVQNGKTPRFTARIKTGADLTNVSISCGTPNASFSQAAYWQYRASAGSGVWEAVTGSDATIVNSIAITASTWYVISIEEQPGYVKFGITPDPDAAIFDPPVMHTITTNVPSTSSTDRRLDFTIQPTENASKEILVDWVKFVTDRSN